MVTARSTASDSPIPTPGAVRRLLRTLPTASVLAGLIGLAYWGHSTGWNFVLEKKVLTRASASGPHRATPKVLFPEAKSGGDRPQPEMSARIEFESAEAFDSAGIGISSVWTAPLTERVTAPGEVSFDPTKFVRVSSRASGVAVRILKLPGDRVRAGEVLALVDAPEVGKAKAELLQGLVQVRHRERLRDDLAGAGAATSPTTLREAEASVREADVRLLAAVQVLSNLGLPTKLEDYRKISPAASADRLRHLGVEDAVKDALPGVHSSNWLPLRAPLDGLVLSADTVAGERVESGKPSFAVVDASRMRITLHVAPEDAPRVKVGQKLHFRPDGGNREYPAIVTRVGSAADESTRRIAVWADADNAGETLRASALGRGRVILREESRAILVAPGAVHALRGQSIVFVRDPDFLNPGTPKVFRVRVVRTGARDERSVEILEGLMPGEIVAGGGSGILLDELARTASGR